MVWRHCGLLFKPVVNFPLENLISAENKLITKPQRQAKPRDVTCKIMTNHLKTITFTFFLIFQISFGQERIIYGKVLAEDLMPLPGVVIKSESKVVATTDFDGNFKFNYTPEIYNLEFLFIGMERENVLIKENCDKIELIMLEESTYCFVSLKTAERKIKKNRKRKLPKLYAEAYKNEIFNNIQSCR